MSARQRNFAALLGGVLALGLSMFYAANASLHAAHMRAEINRAELSSDARTPDQALAQHYLVHAPSHGAAGAALLTRLRQSARNAQISLERAEPRAADEIDPQMVKISAQISGNTQNIAQFLHELEASPPALIVERARLNTQDNGDIAVDILILARARYVGANP